LLNHHSFSCISQGDGRQQHDHTCEIADGAEHIVGHLIPPLSDDNRAASEADLLEFDQ